MTKVFTQMTKVFTQITKVFTQMTKVFTQMTKIFTQMTKVFTEKNDNLWGTRTRAWEGNPSIVALHMYSGYLYAILGIFSCTIDVLLLISSI